MTPSFLLLWSTVWHSWHTLRFKQTTLKHVLKYVNIHTSYTYTSYQRNCKQKYYTEWCHHSANDTVLLHKPNVLNISNVYVLYWYQQLTCYTATSCSPPPSSHDLEMGNFLRKEWRSFEPILLPRKCDTFSEVSEQKMLRNRECSIGSFEDFSGVVTALWSHDFLHVKSPCASCPNNQ